MIRIPANKMNVYLHVGIKLKTGKNIGVPAHTIVNIFIEIVRKRIAIVYNIIFT